MISPMRARTSLGVLKPSASRCAERPNERGQPSAREGVGAGDAGRPACGSGGRVCAGGGGWGESGPGGEVCSDQGTNLELLLALSVGAVGEGSRR